MEDMDPERTHALGTSLLMLVRDHLAAEPHGPFKVYEALNALAVATAAIVCGTGEIAECWNFFGIACVDQITTIEHEKRAVETLTKH